MKRNRSFSIGFPLLLYCLQYISTIQPVQCSEKTNVDDLRPVYYQGVHGKPGVDFPVLTSIPKTSFSCRDLETGYYADLETNCQVFHICEDGKKTSFLCPNGTIFQQSDLICDWWFKVNCTSSPSLYEESSEQLKEELIKKKSARRITWKSSVKTRLDSNNHKNEFISEPNKFPNDEIYEENKVKANSKPDWSSIYNEPQWKNNEATKAKFIEDFDIRTNQEYQSTTEKFEINTGNRNNYRKDTSIGRKKLKEEPRQIIHSIKSKPNRNQFKSDQSSNIPTRSRNEYVTTEENVMTVTPETTTSSETPTKKRFQDKDVQKPYSSTIYSEVKETTTNPYRFYSSRRRKEPIITTSTPKYENQEQKKPVRLESNPEFDQNKYVNIFVGTRQKVIRTNNGRLSDNKRNPFKSYQKIRKIKTNKESSSTKYLNNESNVSSEDSDETQVPQETASIVENNRYINFNREKTEKPTEFYENHKSEYSEIKGPEFYSDKFFNNIVPVTSQYVTTQSFNNGKTFVGSTVGIPIPRNKTYSSNIHDHNKKTFKLSALAFNTAQALNPFQNGKPASNPLIPNTRTSSDYNYSTREPSTVAFTTTEPFNANNNAENSYTEASDDNNKQTVDVSTEAFGIAALNPLNNMNTKTVTLNFGQKEENKKDVLKHSTISFNTAQAYESLFQVDSKSSEISSRAYETTTLSPFEPEVLPDNSPFSSPTDAPFTSRRLEIPTTTQETENYDLVNISFNENKYQSQQEPTTESILPTSTKLPQAPLKPRPFELLSTEASSIGLRNEKSENFDDPLPYPFFQISTASPFSLKEPDTRNEIVLAITESPTTEPTNFYIKPEEVSVNDDIESQESSETFRPGLVVPSSVSPQTLHTLATYFENALSNMTSEERESLNSNDDDLDNADMKEKLKVLLSHMTRQKYEQLFEQMNSNSDENLGKTELNMNKANETTENTEDPQKVRKLAKLFSQALSEYLHDPTNFKNKLIQVRPTEPPSHGNVFNTEKELLSFSEDDSKNTLASLYNATWNFKVLNKTNIDSEENNNFLGPDSEGLTIADSQSFVSQFNNLNYEDKKKVGAENLPKNHWTSSPHATNLWRTTFAVDPFSLNKHFQVTEAYAAVTYPTEVEKTENYSDIESPGSPEEEEIKYELRVFPKVSSNSSKLQGILIDFMNSSTPSEGERLHRILRKLNTTEDEFLDRMKKIEENPLTRRLILLLIHECETTKNEKKELIPFLNPVKQSEDIFSPDPSSVSDDDVTINKDQDDRALQLLNSLYNIATKFGR